MTRVRLGDPSARPAYEEWRRLHIVPSQDEELWTERGRVVILREIAARVTSGDVRVSPDTRPYRPVVIAAPLPSGPAAIRAYRSRRGVRGHGHAS